MSRLINKYHNTASNQTSPRCELWAFWSHLCQQARLFYADTGITVHMDLKHIRNIWFMYNTLMPRQNGCHFPDIFKCFSMIKNVWISIKISLKFIIKGPVNNIPALVQIMAWRRPGDKPLSEPIVVSLPTHICVTRPQWVNASLRWLWCKYIHPRWLLI